LDPLELAAATSQTLALNRRRHWSSVRARSRRKSCRSAAPSPPQATSGAPCCGENIRWSLSPLPFAPARARSLTVAPLLSAPSAASTPHADAANAFVAPHFRYPANPRPYPSPGPPFLATPASPLPCAAAGRTLRCRPSRSTHGRRWISIQGPRLDLIQVKIPWYLSTLGVFAKKPLSFTKINPHSTAVQK